jgi:hypothetical protein
MHVRLRVNYSLHGDMQVGILKFYETKRLVPIYASKERGLVTEHISCQSMRTATEEQRAYR